MSQRLDRNRRRLCNGSQVFWYGGGLCGSVITIENHDYPEMVCVRWHHMSDDYLGDWYYPENLVFITEEDFVTFLSEPWPPTESDPSPPRTLGRKFCDKFRINDRGLKDERCPGKARKRIVDLYAMHIR